MYYYAVLIILTAVIAAITGCLWAKVRNGSLVLGMVFLYYWSLQGAWILVHDKLAHVTDAPPQYLSYEDALFPILLDSSYLETLLLYGLFIVVVGAVLLYRVNRPPDSGGQRRPTIWVSHTRLMMIAAFAGLGSFLIIRRAMGTAISSDISIYVFTRTSFAFESRYFTLHQVFTQICLVALAIGIPVCRTGERGRFVAGHRSRTALLGYLLVLGGMLWFMSLLGNRGETLMAGVTGLLFYNVNAPKTRRAATLVAIALLLVNMNFIYFVRGATVESRSEQAKRFDPAELAEFLTTNNEEFAAHFSLYGTLKQNVPLTYGSSLISLSASVVPKILWPDRPKDVYVHYAKAVHAKPGEGYTIHHVTGWYLNFGVSGVVLGAIVLGWFWSTLFNRFFQHPPDPPALLTECIRVLAPWTFVAYLPQFIRAGPEVYKPCIFEAILLPASLLYVSALRAQRDTVHACTLPLSDDGDARLPSPPRVRPGLAATIDQLRTRSGVM
jgi:hypothetical protein